ncbi:metallophosphoesterase family protein [Belnapia sp. T18]|uniref:Metallophosphoesterase family protein n=1 Tax=Belnapia arida TaxID=2804533 RepID=A0ABS1UCX6_9PROT|nr:metallophosphoesterase family protein [Belnapia arida]
MRVAVLADAHGNLLALEAVLADMHAQAPDLIVNLGDLTIGPFDPVGNADAQIALGCTTLAGKHERNLIEGDDASGSVAFARPCCRQRTWPGSKPCLRRRGSWVGRCSPVTVALPAATSTICSMTCRAADLFLPLRRDLAATGRHRLRTSRPMRPHAHAPRGPGRRCDGDKPWQRWDARLHGRRPGAACDRDRSATRPLCSHYARVGRGVFG